MAGTWTGGGKAVSPAPRSRQLPRSERFGPNRGALSGRAAVREPYGGLALVLGRQAPAARFALSQGCISACCPAQPEGSGAQSGAGSCARRRQLGPWSLRAGFGPPPDLKGR